MFSQQRRGERLLHRPLQFTQAVRDDHMGKTDFSAPLYESHGLATVCDDSIPSRIRRLFKSRLPSAVLRRIAKVVVDSPDRHFRFWFLSHISKKCCEAVSPAIANRDAPRPIIGIGGVLRVMAPLLDVVPRAVFHSADSTVSQLGVSRPLSLKTPAALRVTQGKTLRDHLNVIAAITNAMPISPPLAPRVRQHLNCKSSELPINQIVRSRHISFPEYCTTQGELHASSIVATAGS